jgi:hypothetical protein
MCVQDRDVTQVMANLLAWTERVRALAPPFIEKYELGYDRDGIPQLVVTGGSRTVWMYGDEVYRLWLECMTVHRPWCQPPLHDYC